MARTDVSPHGRLSSDRASIFPLTRRSLITQATPSKLHQRGALLLVGLTVGALIAAAASGPFQFGARGPRASLALPAGASLPMSPFSVMIEPLAPLSLMEFLHGGGGLSVRRVAEAFDHAGYDLTTVAKGTSGVPRLYLTSMPHDLGEMPEVAARKELFFRTVLPLVLRVNAEIREDRRKLWNIHYRKQLHKPISASDRRWLAELAERYEVSANDDEELLRRVDAVPPSLALAQAAEESGWGTSRFVREGNALFGQWTFGGDGHLIPVARAPGRNHKIMAFPSLIGSVRAYANNLNTHRAYREFRDMRVAYRESGRSLSGLALAGALGRYSERGPEYVRAIRGMITANGLDTLDQARLRGEDVEASLERLPWTGSDRSAADYPDT